MVFLDPSFLIDIRIKNPNIEPLINKLDLEGLHKVPSIVAHITNAFHRVVQLRTVLPPEFHMFKLFSRIVAYLEQRVESITGFIFN